MMDIRTGLEADQAALQAFTQRTKTAFVFFAFAAVLFSPLGIWGAIPTFAIGVYAMARVRGEGARGEENWKPHWRAAYATLWVGGAAVLTSNLTRNPWITLAVVLVVSVVACFRVFQNSVFERPDMKWLTEVVRTGKIPEGVKPEVKDTSAAAERSWKAAGTELKDEVKSLRSQVDELKQLATTQGQVLADLATTYQTGAQQSAAVLALMIDYLVSSRRRGAWDLDNFKTAITSPDDQVGQVLAAIKPLIESSPEQPKTQTTNTKSTS